MLNVTMLSVVAPYRFVFVLQFLFCFTIQNRRKSLESIQDFLIHWIDDPGANDIKLFPFITYGQNKLECLSLPGKGQSLT